MKSIAPESVYYDENIEDPACATTGRGQCHHLAQNSCSVHARYGYHAKPSGCRRFPFGLVATPIGGRVTTEHRCPGRILSMNSPLTLQQAETSLRDRAGRLQADRRISNRIRLNRKKHISFMRYLKIETKILQALALSTNPLTALNAKPFPNMVEGSWPVIAAEFFESRDGTSCGEALAWFGDALLSLTGGHHPPPRKRPWKHYFDRTYKRYRAPIRSSQQLFKDWMADEIWMFRALEWGPFDVALAELATRYQIARRIQQRITSHGVPTSQAAAEAVMIVEIATVSTEWSRAVERVSPQPCPGGTDYFS